MSITDELREWLDTGKVHWFGRRPEIEPMLDRIDAEHESKVSYWQGASYKDGYDEGFASADDYFTDKRETLKEHGWVKLPVDAKGEHIHAGDMLDGYGKTIEVVEIRHGLSGWVIISRDGNGYADTFAFTHHHPPTVEDVLDEFVARWMDTHHDDLPALKAEYAAKLRLRGEDE